MDRSSRMQLISLSAIWAILWTLVSIVESAAYIHDPTIPRWQPLVLVGVLVLTLGVWLTFEIRRAPFVKVPLDPPGRWFLSQLRRLPWLALGYVITVHGLRHAAFGIAGAEYFHLPWAVLIPFEFVKAAVFYCIWLGLAFGTLSMCRAREQSAQLLLIQKALAEAQLAQLQAQLRPHFLFNTLNTVSSLMQFDVARADRVLTRLGDFLRATLSAATAPLVPLHEELRLLRLYADIMQERFAGRVSMHWHVDAEVSDVLVPAMLLQPLLENAFKYGVESTIGDERISIAASRASGQLRVCIHNSCSMLDAGWTAGIGIGNCRDRLQVLYGAAASVDLADGTPQGVVASVLLPMAGEMA